MVIIVRPAPIPDAAVWPGARRVVMAAPSGDLTDPVVAPVEALVDHVESTDGLRYSSRCVLEPGDLAALQAGGHVWVQFYGGMPPWSVAVTDGEAGPLTAERRRELAAAVEDVAPDAWWNGEDGDYFGGLVESLVRLGWTPPSAAG